MDYVLYAWRQRCIMGNATQITKPDCVFSTRRLWHMTACWWWPRHFEIYADRRSTSPAEATPETVWPTQLLPGIKALTWNVLWNRWEWAGLNKTGKGHQRRIRIGGTPTKSEWVELCCKDESGQKLTFIKQVKVDRTLTQVRVGGAYWCWHREWAGLLLEN